MKKSLHMITMLLSIAIALNSCKATQETKAQRKAEIKQSKESTTACFVQMNDGTIKNYSTLRLVRGILKTPYLLADGKIKITAKEIKAYQNKEHYAVSQQCFVSGHKTYVAKETLPGFAIRIAKGRINVYAKKYYNGIRAVDEYFVQKGDAGQILAYTTENMNKLSKDDEETTAFFTAKKYNTTKLKNDPLPAATPATSDNDSYANIKKIRIAKKNK